MKGIKVGRDRKNYASFVYKSTSTKELSIYPLFNQKKITTTSIILIIHHPSRLLLSSPPITEKEKKMK